MRLCVVTILLILAKCCSAQDYGIQWVIGGRESVLDFRHDTLTNYPIGPIMPMFLTEANICDPSGNLLFYTNGIYIARRDGVPLVNGDSLSPCDYTNQWACCGLNIPQAALFLPKPGDTTSYYLFHFSNDTVNGGRPGTLYYSLIDRTAYNDYGKVVNKNIPFFSGKVFREGGMTACKHANGRDWWIVMGDHYTNAYYKFLLTPDTILGPFAQSIGPSYVGPFDVACGKFSQDGSKYVTSCYAGPILVMDFDRCSGEFSNAITFVNPDSGGLVEFSPNGRFVYATNAINLTQFDLSSADPQHDSVSLYQSPNGDPVRMSFLQIAPNGKLYASCFNGGYYFIHAVNYPDLKGIAADYVDTAYTTLTANSANFPNMINYRLGALQGSGCDTINTGLPFVQTEGLNLRVMPNPADKYLYVEMGAPGNYEFELYNELGRLVAQSETRQVDIFDVSYLPQGVYFLKATDINTSSVTTRKVIVAHL